MATTTSSVLSDLDQNQRNSSLNGSRGFTAPLMEYISESKSKIQKWVDHEKVKIDSRAESYRAKLNDQETIIKSQVEELAIVQRERGMDDENRASTDNTNQEDRPENIAARKKSLEEQSAKIQIDVMKLKAERDNREKRVQGKSYMIAL